MLIWFSETRSTWKHLELDYCVSLGSKGFHEKDFKLRIIAKTRPLNPYFPEGLKWPRDWPKAIESI